MIGASFTSVEFVFIELSLERKIFIEKSNKCFITRDQLISLEGHPFPDRIQASDEIE